MGYQVREWHQHDYGCKLCPTLPRIKVLTVMSLVDTVQYRLLLKGIPRHFSWDCDRRFCTWSQCDTPSRRFINPVLEDQSSRYPTKRLEAFGSLGKPKSQPHRYPFPRFRPLPVRSVIHLFARLRCLLFLSSETTTHTGQMTV